MLNLIDILVIFLMIICIYFNIRKNSPLQTIMQLINIICVAMITFAVFSIIIYWFKVSVEHSLIKNCIVFGLCFGISYILYYFWSKWHGDNVISNFSSSTKKHKILCTCIGLCKGFVILFILYATSLSVAPPLYFQWPRYLILNIQNSYTFPIIDYFYNYTTCSSVHPNAETKAKCYQEHRDSLRLSSSQ